ncbi:TIGR02391 family protein [uncultured Desulfovibrio sp.]|uniref:TIGR02391 family protein n=1 Tax=uncultured Desulfovibrio sp. TaxID=167968 RepID=UPI00272A0FEB|nr:TIGR02391 family protein [uncultured Desulfovibrio sp.]
MIEHIEKISDWIEHLIKKHDPDIGNLSIDAKTQKNILYHITCISTNLKKIHPYLSKRLFEIGEKLFYTRQFSNPILPPPQSQFYPYGQIGNYHIPILQSPITIIKESIISINICMFCRLHEIILFLKNNNYEDINWDYIHKSIVDISKQKFLDGHYADAVETAFKYINTYIKDIYLKSNPKNKDLTGAPLMSNIFANEPLKISLEEQDTETGRNIQKGYARIFEGCMLAIRNQTAHDNIVMSKEMAFQKLALASLLVTRLEKAKINIFSPEQ